MTRCFCLLAALLFLAACGMPEILAEPVIDTPEVVAEERATGPALCPEVGGDDGIGGTGCSEEIR